MRRLQGRHTPPRYPRTLVTKCHGFGGVEKTKKLLPHGSEDEVQSHSASGGSIAHEDCSLPAWGQPLPRYVFTRLSSMPVCKQSSPSSFPSPLRRPLQCHWIRTHPMPSFNLNSHLLLLLLLPTVSHWAAKLQHMNLGGHLSVHITHGWLYVFEYTRLSKQDLMLTAMTAFSKEISARPPAGRQPGLSLYVVYFLLPGLHSHPARVETKHRVSSGYRASILGCYLRSIAHSANLDYFLSSLGVFNPLLSSPLLSFSSFLPPSLPPIISKSCRLCFCGSVLLSAQGRQPSA